MIRYGELIRFTSHEIEEFRRIGLDLSDARDQTTLELELNRWAELLGQERPNLLEQIARAMGEAKGLRADEEPSGAEADDF